MNTLTDEQRAEFNRKREITMVKRYGVNWRESIGRKAHATKMRKYGRQMYQEAGRKGSENVDPKNRRFAKHPEIAKELAPKAAAKRWRKK